MLRAKYFNSIDEMPIHNYLKVVDGNLKFLVVKRGIFGDAIKAFEDIQRQLVDRFGISENFAEILELRREICELQCEVAITENRFQNTFIRIKEQELEQLLAIKGSTNEELKTIIEKWLGFKLNLQQISVVEWFTYLKQFSQSQQTKAA
jgi:VIT1/CCC1 family predicted Fe2+/Mn2+ transporter